MDFRELEQSITQKKGLVIGDQYLDRNAVGGYRGYSREVENLPIFKIATERYGPGGAGNLLANLVGLNVPTVAVGVWGDVTDIHRVVLEGLFRSSGVDVSGMVVGARTPTFEKYYYPSTNHVMRLDVDTEEIADNTRAELVQKVVLLSPTVDFVVAADYDEHGKGVCCKDVLVAVAAAETQKFGTSRNRIGELQGFGTLVINEKELMEAAHERTEPEMSAAFIMTATGARTLVVTLGGRGARVYERRGGTIDLRAESPLTTHEVPSASVGDEKIDTCGAGDTFLAVLIACIVSGVDIIDSVQAANAGARAAIRKLFGASPVSLADVEREYNEMYKL